MRRSEDFHNTPEQVEAAVRGACDIADRVGLDREDRAVLLPVMTTALLSKQIFYEQPQPVPPGLDLNRMLRG